MLLKNLCPVQEESERSEDLSDNIPKPERSLAPTKPTMTARVVFHYAARSLKELSTNLLPAVHHVNRKITFSLLGEYGSLGFAMCIP